MLALYRCRPPGGGARGLPARRARPSSRSSGSSRAGSCRSSSRRSCDRARRSTAARRGGRSRRTPHAGVFVGPRARARRCSRRARRRARRARARRAGRGEPGIGKSRLAEELAARARARGARVLVGRCWEAGGAPAYWPWVQALRAYVRETEPAALRAQLGAGAATSPSCCPSCASCSRTCPSRRRRIRGRPLSPVRGGRLASARAPRRPGRCVLVLDDLHAADEPSLLLLRFMAREIAGSRLLVVGAFRDVDPTLRDPLTRRAGRARARAAHRADRARRA